LRAPIHDYDDLTRAHNRARAIYDSDELTSDLHPSQLGRGGGIEEQGLQQERATRRPHQSTVQTTPLKLLRLNDRLALRGDDEAPERVKKRVLQYKHLAARPTAYTTDKVIKPQQAMDLMRLSLIS